MRVWPVQSCKAESDGAQLWWVARVMNSMKVSAGPHDTEPSKSYLTSGLAA